MTKKDKHPTAVELATQEELDKARQRGEKLGYQGAILDSFIYDEIRLQRKVRDRAKL